MLYMIFNLKRLLTFIFTIKNFYFKIDGSLIETILHLRVFEMCYLELVKVLQKYVGIQCNTKS